MCKDSSNACRRGNRGVGEIQCGFQECDRTWAVGVLPELSLGTLLDALSGKND